MEKKVLTYWGENYWGHSVYQLQGKEKYYADLGNENHHHLHTLSPINDPDGEPDMPINPENFIIKAKPQEPKKSREEQKFILAKMVAANEYEEGKTSVEWVDLASSIKDLNLTKELLKELKDHPMELKFVSGHGWLEKEQADALEVLSHYQLNSADKKFRYQMLSRMQSDCEYYLGYGNRSVNRLWAQNEKKQIEIMKALYNSFHDWEKPEWISMESILKYESQMLYPFVIDGIRMRILAPFLKDEKYTIVEADNKELYVFYNLKSDGTYERKHECKKTAPGFYGMGTEIKPSGNEVKRLIKIYAGLTQEFEVIQTTAPDEVIIAQIRENNRLSKEGILIENPYGVIKRHGFSVECIGCQEDDELMEEIKIDAKFDSYHYEPEKDSLSVDSESANEEKAKGIGTEINHAVELKLYNDMTLTLDNQNGKGACIASLINTDGEVALVKVIDEKKLFQFICSQKDASKELLKKFYNIAISVRTEMEDTYGEDLQGKCIEASERIAKRISEELRIEAKTVEGWCRFDDEDYGSDHPWDPHTWVEIPLLNLYVDIIADQFNCGMNEDYPKVLVQKGLPHGMQYEEPSWDDLNRD